MVTIVINLLGGLGKLHNLSEPRSSFNKKESQPVPTVGCGLHAFVSTEHLAHCKHSVNGTIYLFKAHLFRLFLHVCHRLPGSHYQVHRGGGVSSLQGSSHPWLSSLRILLLGP